MAEVVCDSFELLAAEITNITVVNIYVHANTAPDYPALRTALASIPHFATRNVIVGGDFNHPRTRAELEQTVMAPLGLSPTHDPDFPAPTRGENPLDLIFWKGQDIGVNLVGAFTGSTSDHKLVVADVRGTDVASMIAPIEAPDLIQWTNCPKVPFDCLSQELKAKWAPMFHALQAATSEQHWNTADPVTSLQASLLSVAATHLGTKKYRTKQRTCWWNHGLTKLSRRVRRAHRRTQLPNLSEAKLRRHKAQHKAVEKQYRQACTKARRRALSDFQAHFEPRDMNRTWRATESHRGKRHPRYVKRVAADPDAAADFWTGVFMEPRFDRPDPPSADPSREDVFQSSREISAAISKMNDTAPGQDGLRACLLTFLKSSSVAMDNIKKGFNHACRLTISDRAKSSVTVLIKKPRASGSDPANYRPIALQPVMTKLLSKCVECQIWKQVEDGSVHLSDTQAGFRPNRSRYDLIFLLRCAQEHFQPGGRKMPRACDHRVFAAFLDITKAYDSVPHIKIIECLRKAGVKEPLIHVVLDLLTNRTTIIYGHTIKIGRGVPQGDPLSPLLFILIMQPLSDALAQYQGGGITLPGDLLLKDLLYADDIGLLAESIEELQGMLQVCEKWALENGFTFSVGKSKVMILTGNTVPTLPTVFLHDSPLEWVQVFPYLGFPIYAFNKPRKYLPLDLNATYQVLGPMATAVHHESLVGLPVIQRAHALVVMVEGKAMHNAQVADLDVKNINSYVNRGVKAITGLVDSTLLRCDLGILPAELVVHRNALYFLWHLRHQAWFKAYLPGLATLQPLGRLTSMLLYYPSLRIDVLDTLDYKSWRKRVKLAIIERAESFYNTSDYQASRLYPHPDYYFAYRGQRYTTNSYTTDHAQIALELRQDRLPLPRHLRPWEHHPCPMCSEPRSLNGRHLLQCPALLADTPAT